MFGRAHEEIVAATEAGMDIAIVPGITSAIAVPASKMIPVTCRGINESFWVVTGTTQTGDISKIFTWRAIICYSNYINEHEQAEPLPKYLPNAAAETAAAVIQNGTLPNEKMVTGKLKDIYFRAQHAELENPAIIIIGDVVHLHTLAVNNMYNNVH